MQGGERRRLLGHEGQRGRGEGEAVGSYRSEGEGRGGGCWTMQVRGGLGLPNNECNKQTAFIFIIYTN